MSTPCTFGGRYKLVDKASECTDGFATITGKAACQAAAAANGFNWHADTFSTWMHAAKCLAGARYYASGVTSRFYFDIELQFRYPTPSSIQRRDYVFVCGPDAESPPSPSPPPAPLAPPPSWSLETACLDHRPWPCVSSNGQACVVHGHEVADIACADVASIEGICATKLNIVFAGCALQLARAQSPDVSEPAPDLYGLLSVC